VHGPARWDAQLQAVAGPAVYDIRVCVPDPHVAALDDRDDQGDLRPRVREVDVQDAEGGAEPRDDVDPDPAQQVEGDEDDGGRGGAEVVPGAGSQADGRRGPEAGGGGKPPDVQAPADDRAGPRNPTPVTTCAAILVGSNWTPRPPLSSAARVNSANP
jgi:hypothetical protein